MRSKRENKERKKNVFLEYQYVIFMELSHQIFVFFLIGAIDLIISKRKN